MRTATPKQTLALCLLLLLLAACGGIPTRSYFLLGYSFRPDRPAPDDRIYPYNVRIKQLDIAQAYRKMQIVYRYSPYEIQYYVYKLWAVRPDRMVTDLLFRHLAHNRLFAGLSTQFGTEKPDLVLTGEIEAIEEFDSGDTWLGHLAVTIRLLRFSDQAEVWRYRFDRTKVVYHKAPIYVVRAISELLEEENYKLEDELRSFLDRNPDLSGSAVPPG